MMITLFYYAIITMQSMYYVPCIFTYLPHTNSWAEVNKPSNRKFTNSMYIDGIEYWRTKLLPTRSDRISGFAVNAHLTIGGYIKNNNYYYETYFLDNTQWKIWYWQEICVFSLVDIERIFYSTENESEYYTLFQPLSSLYYVGLRRRDKSKPYGQKILCTKKWLPQFKKWWSF